MCDWKCNQGRNCSCARHYSASDLLLPIAFTLLAVGLALLAW